MNERKGEHPLGDAAQLVMLAVFCVAWVTDTLLLRRSRSLRRRVPLALRLGVFGLSLATAMLLLLPAHGVTAGGGPDHVVQSGPFRYVRHPIYLASLLAYLGVGLASLSLFCLALLAPIFAIYNYLAGYEERLLEERFGDTYRDYQAQTGKWLPRIGRDASREETSAV